ncbi:hypothetical protein E2C01_000803 [Portunus trituberculatus]|uniref:Uncharacterized protein n=1 Tax=Portunus trituberculatus TaxID=210409 RepID=A0A5B7CIL5_PORTR|nr:hypothetical protein [Portunus trituberculatus]
MSKKLHSWRRKSSVLCNTRKSMSAWQLQHTTQPRAHNAKIYPPRVAAKHTRQQTPTKLQGLNEGDAGTLLNEKYQLRSSPAHTSPHLQSVILEELQHGHQIMSVHSVGLSVLWQRRSTRGGGAGACGDP